MMNMIEEGARQMPGMMGSAMGNMGGAMGGMGSMMGNMGQMMAHPMASGAMMAAGGYAAGKGLLGGLFRNPLVVLAAGVAAGYLVFRYQKEIVDTAAKVTGMGKDFVQHQKENLDDLIAETKSSDAPARE